MEINGMEMDIYKSLNQTFININIKIKVKTYFYE